jgi:hypothetical protein
VLCAFDLLEFLKRHKLSLDLFWIEAGSLTDTDALLVPGILGRARTFY